MKKLFLIAVLLGLSACDKPVKDYDAQAFCRASGIAAGTAEFESCVKQERARKMLEEQRRDYERTKQERRDWQMQRIDY